MHADAPILVGANPCLEQQTALGPAHLAATCNAKDSLAMHTWPAAAASATPSNEVSMSEAPTGSVTPGSGGKLQALILFPACHCLLIISYRRRAIDIGDATTKRNLQCNGVDHHSGTARASNCRTSTDDFIDRFWSMSNIFNAMLAEITEVERLISYFRSTAQRRSRTTTSSSTTSTLTRNEWNAPFAITSSLCNGFRSCGNVTSHGSLGKQRARSQAPNDDIGCSYHLSFGPIYTLQYSIYRDLGLPTRPGRSPGLSAHTAPHVLNGQRCRSCYAST